jgi:YfiH family protein
VSTPIVPRSTWTSRVDGDLAGDLSEARPGWTWLHQVHGAEVVVVTRPGEHAGAHADAAVTAVPGCVLAVRSADCAPVVLLGERAVGVVHAGWRGLVAGVVDQAVGAMRDLGDAPRSARLGPCIRVGCYEFDGAELDDLAARYGAVVRGRTTWGTPALDLAAAVHVALGDAGVTEVQDTSGCTACDTRWYSHRARGDAERFATTAWLEER